jgi:pimeloyl-ACP methyl ester carboxylesterase
LILKRTKQEGRIPLRAVARAEFCYHSLQRIFSIYITLTLPWQVPQGARFLRPSSFRRLPQNSIGLWLTQGIFPIFAAPLRGDFAFRPSGYIFSKIASVTPIVYLHGFASSPASSKARYFHDRLTAAGASVTIPDLTADDFEHLTLSSQLQVLSNHIGGACRLMGSSMGGYLAALHAARSPLVERLVLLAPAFSFHDRWHERLGPDQMAQWRETGRMEVFHYGFNEMRPISYNLIDDATRYPAYPDFSQPALIFHGRFDDIVPASYSERFAAGRPNVHLEIVDSGHDLLNVLDQISPQIIEFLTQ